jgi:hypothetical protein
MAAAALTAVLAAAAAASSPVEFPHHWGGAGMIAGRHSESFCSAHHIAPGGHRRIVTTFTFRGHHQTHAGTVFCSHEYEVWKGTTGPWNDGHWISIACPAGERPMSSGAGFVSDPGGALTQVGGGFGHNDDGFWHYRFHNWDHAHMAKVQFWGVCLGPEVRV